MRAASNNETGPVPAPPAAAVEKHNSVAPLLPAGNPSRWIIVCGVILAGLIIAATTTLLFNLRNRDLADKQHVLENLTLVLAEQIDRSFQSIELVQTAEIERAKNLGIASPAELRERLADYGTHQRLKAQISALPFVDAFVLTDAEGNLINFSRSWPIPNVKIPDPDPHEAFSTEPQLNSLVGTPIPSPATGKWVLPIARRLSGRNGEFLGVVTGVMELQYFEQLFQSLVNTPHDSIVMFRRDGTLLARFPREEPAIGRLFANSKFLDMAKTANHGTVREIGVIDGRERLVAFHSAAHFPVVVIATATVADTLANWQRRLIGMVAAVLATGLVIAGGVSFGIWRIGRKFREQNLQRDVALDNMSQGLVMYDSAGRLVICNDRYRQIYGLPHELAKPGTTIRDVLKHRATTGTFSGDVEKHAQELLVKTARGETISHVTETEDGRSIAVVGRQVAGGGWVATHQDITEAKRAETLLKESRDDLACAEVMALLGHYRIDLATGEYSCSDGYYRLFGKSSATFKPTLRTVLELIHPDDRPALEQYRHDIAAGIECPPLMLRGVRDNGEITYIEGASKPVRAADGKVIGMFGTLQDVTERKRAEAVLAQTSAFLQTVIANMPLMLTVKNAKDLTYVLVNPAAEKALFKVPAAAMIGKRADEFFTPDHAALLEAFDRDVLAGGKPVAFEDTIEDASGNPHNVITTKAPIIGGDGELSYLITLSQDVTDRKRAESALASAHRQLTEKQFAIDQAVTVTVTDPAGKITYVNDNFCHISGYSREELLGNDHRLVNSGTHPASFFEDMYRTIAAGQVWRGEICNKTKSSLPFWVHTTIVPQLGDDGQPTAYMAIRVDITARKQAEEQISYMANHDTLTGLGNRAILIEKLKEALARSQLHGETLAVLMLDLDGFKHVNDTLGHAAGDNLLKDVAARLQSSLNETDILARLGGDEFAIIQAGETNQQEAAIDLAVRLLGAVTVPFDIEGQDVAISTSMGIAVAPKDGSSPGELLQKADLALYRVKAEGRNHFRFFDQEMSERAAARLRLLNDLRTALNRSEFEMQYQPIFDARTHSPCGVEALVRWRHPTRGLVPPDRFIPLAEETGLMEPLGDWILERACADATAWPDNVKIAVNLSATQFRRDRLFDVILCALVESGLSPSRLELEITESVLMQNTEANSVVLQQLKNIGVSIVLDDFGTGYSSLNYLTMFPFDKIKIDKSFTQGLTNNAACAASVASVLTLARALDMTVIAEGVETPQQLELLRAAGVHQVQGYLFAQPRPAAELCFAELERKGHTIAAA